MKKKKKQQAVIDSKGADTIVVMFRKPQSRIFTQAVQAKAATNRILKNYRIPSTKSADL